MKKISVVIIFTSLLVFCGCDKPAKDHEKSEIAVTNSYLYSAVRDVAGDMKVRCLASPGMCPGHFDVAPADVQSLGVCKLLLRFDFQSGMDEQMQRLSEKGLRIREIASMPGLCVPASYKAACEGVSRVLSQTYPQRQDEFQSHVKQITARMDLLAEQMQSHIKNAGLTDANVVCSIHQAEFAKSLGLNVVSTFLGSDLATPANLMRCLGQAEGKTISFVIANKQEGTELAAALAKRLNAKMVVMSNFPAVDSAGGDFDTLVMENVTQITGGGNK